MLSPRLSLAACCIFALGCGGLISTPGGLFLVGVKLPTASDGEPGVDEPGRLWADVAIDDRRFFELPTGDDFVGTAYVKQSFPAKHRKSGHVARVFTDFMRQALEGIPIGPLTGALDQAFDPITDSGHVFATALDRSGFSIDAANTVVPKAAGQSVGRNTRVLFKFVERV